MNPQKIFWFDTETTGVDENKSAIIQLSGSLEIIDGDPNISYSTKDFNILMRPFDGAEITDEALEKNGRTREEIAEFPEWQRQITCLKTAMSKYVNKFDREDKFFPAGYNIGFDTGILNRAFERSGDVYFWSWFFWPSIDVKVVLAQYMIKTGLRLENYKLETVCNHFKIEIDAHDAMSDIRATRELYYTLKNQLA